MISANSSGVRTGTNSSRGVRALRARRRRAKVATADRVVGPRRAGAVGAVGVATSGGVMVDNSVLRSEVGSGRRSGGSGQAASGTPVNRR